MPYIAEEDRDRVLSTKTPKNTGELNYLITVIVDEYVGINGLNYKSINDVVGVLGAVTQEFYSRVARPYEDQKRKENGEVFCYWK